MAIGNVANRDAASRSTFSDTTDNDGPPPWDGPSVHLPTAIENYFFVVFFVAFFVFFPTFLGALGFALRVPIFFATFRS